MRPCKYHKEDICRKYYRLSWEAEKELVYTRLLNPVQSRPYRSGKHRIVDIPISNCINSGLRQIYVLTQFNSASLHLHIARAYRFDSFSNGFVEILAAEQTFEHSGWYEGTADAVRKTLLTLKRKIRNTISSFQAINYIV